MNAGTYIASRTFMGNVCKNNSDSFWCQPLGNLTVFLIVFAIFCYFASFDLKSFYKKQENINKRKLKVLLIWMVTLPKRIISSLKEIYRSEK